MFPSHSWERPTLEYKKTLLTHFSLPYHYVCFLNHILIPPNLINPNLLFPNFNSDRSSHFQTHLLLSRHLYLDLETCFCSEKGSNDSKCMGSAYLYCVYKYYHPIFKARQTRYYVYVMLVRVRNSEL